MALEQTGQDIDILDIAIHFFMNVECLISGVKGVKELSLPAVAEELRQMLLEGNVLMFDFKQ